MADFKKAWLFTAENEGSDSSYEQYTKWGVTAPFLIFWKLAKDHNAKTMISSMTAAKAGFIVKNTIWNKVVQGDKINDQNLANILLDLGFNKPKYAIQFVCEIYGINPKKAIDKFQIPNEVIEILNRPGQNVSAYEKVWAKWWNWSINSGHFKEGSVVGLSKRIWRYKNYGEVGNKDILDGVHAALRDTTHAGMRKDLEKYISKKSGKAKLKMATPQKKGIVMLSPDTETQKEINNNNVTAFVVGSILVAVGIGISIHMYNNRNK